MHVEFIYLKFKDVDSTSDAGEVKSFMSLKIMFATLLQSFLSSAHFEL